MTADFINLELLADAVARRMQSQASLEQRLFDLDSAAKYCGMPVESFRKKVVKYRVPKARLDKCWRFDRSDLDDLIERHKERGEAA